MSTNLTVLRTFYGKIPIGVPALKMTSAQHNSIIVFIHALQDFMITNQGMNGTLTPIFNLVPSLRYVSATEKGADIDHNAILDFLTLLNAYLVRIGGGLLTLNLTLKLAFIRHVQSSDYPLAQDHNAIRDYCGALCDFFGELQNALVDLNVDFFARDSSDLFLFPDGWFPILRVWSWFYDMTLDYLNAHTGGVSMRFDENHYSDFTEFNHESGHMYLSSDNNTMIPKKVKFGNHIFFFGISGPQGTNTSTYHGTVTINGIEVSFDGIEDNAGVGGIPTRAFEVDFFIDAGGAVTITKSAIVEFPWQLVS